MRQTFLLLLGAAILSCFQTALVAQPGPPATKTFLALMSGDQEVDPVETPARGVAAFQRRGNALFFIAVVARIENVVAAHVHLGPEGQNGPIVVPLVVGLAPGGGPFNGVLARGMITAGDLTGPLAGMTLADLVAEMTAGNTYVNVHTDDGVNPPNSGPGNFPGGEIRGQVRALN